MPDIQHIFISNTDIKLEAEYYQPKNEKIKTSILICHPHPLYGGDMHNNVVSSIFNKFIENHKTTLRFNFRAVGNSTGSHTNGEGEISDVKACVDYLIKNLKIDSILICGYSYGAAIGCSIVSYSSKIIGFIAISFPWDFMGQKYKILSQTDKPKLFLQGNRDTLAHYDKFLGHYNDYNEPKKFDIIDGADHFYWGYENQVAEKVYNFYSSIK